MSPSSVFESRGAAPRASVIFCNVILRRSSMHLGLLRCWPYGFVFNIGIFILPTNSYCTHLTTGITNLNYNVFSRRMLIGNLKTGELKTYYFIMNNEGLPLPFASEASVNAFKFKKECFSSRRFMAPTSHLKNI